MKIIDADRLKQHYAWWGNENQEIFDTIVDEQPPLDVIFRIDAVTKIKSNMDAGATAYNTSELRTAFKTGVMFAVAILLSMPKGEVKDESNSD